MLYGVPSLTPLAKLKLLSQAQDLHQISEDMMDMIIAEVVGQELQSYERPLLESFFPSHSLQKLEANAAASSYLLSPSDVTTLAYGTGRTVGARDTPWRLVSNGSDALLNGQYGRPLFFWLKLQMSTEKHPGCLAHAGDCTTQLYGEYHKQL